MKALYFLPIFSINLFAHVNNSIHFHFIENLIYLIILFAYICLGISVLILMRAIYRRFVWKLKM